MLFRFWWAVQTGATQATVSSWALVQVLLIWWLQDENATGLVVEKSNDSKHK